MENPAVVIDSGAQTTKSGFGGEENPKYCFPSLVAKPRYNIQEFFEDVDLYFGNDGLERKEVMEITHSVTSDTRLNFNAMKQIWRHIYHDELKVEPEEQPVLLSESPLNEADDREKMVEFFFEDLKVPAFYLCPQAVLALYSSGKTTGVVLDSGLNYSFASVVYEGIQFCK